MVQVCAERVATRTSMVRERSERCKDAQTSRSKRRNVPRRKASAEQRRLICAQNSSLKTASHRQTNDSKKCCRFFVGLPSPRLRGHYFSLVCRRKRQNAGARLIPQRVSPLRAPRKFIPKQRAQNCYAPTNNDSKKMLSFFVGLPSPRLRGLV